MYSAVVSQQRDLSSFVADSYINNDATVCFVMRDVDAVAGPIEMEDADLSVISPTLSTPDVERRDAGAQERTKKDVTGKELLCIL